MKQLLVLSVLLTTQTALALPQDFTHLSKIDPSIKQEIRYAGYDNFTGRPVKGYIKPTCILTKQAAHALHKVQKTLQKQGLSLRVYDCYRPQKAVNDFVTWSKRPNDQLTKTKYYPHEPKKTLFNRGYIAHHSGHTRGSTVDLTIDGLDMGTTFDFLDPAGHFRYPYVSLTAYRNRLLLRHVMLKNGFKPYDKEWWHFTLKYEPYPNTYFNFPVK